MVWRDSISPPREVDLRGSDKRTGSLFSYVGVEGRLRPDHPLRTIRVLTDETLAAMERELAALYSGIGRPSIAPQMLLRAMLLQAFYSVRSERQLMERMEFDLLFRWFVGLGADEPVWDASTFSKNRDRLLEGDVAARFLATLMARPRVKRLLSSDHFSVDGTMIQAWASMKSVKPIEGGSGPDDKPPSSSGRNAEADFHGETRTNATHVSTTDPEAKLYRKGAGMEAKLAFLGHALMENRCGLVVDACLTQANGHAERLAALAMIEKRADRARSHAWGGQRLRYVRLRERVALHEGAPARDPTPARIGHRSAHHAPSRLSREPAHPQAHRRSVWLDEDDRRHAAADAARRRPHRMVLHLRSRRLQSREIAEATRRARNVSKAQSPIVGRWRIIGADPIIVEFA